MSDNTSIEWTNATWNPITGCTKVTAGCDHCLDPETLVLYADFTWRRLGDVQVGDILIGFDEYVQNESGRGMRMLRPSTVTALWHTHQPAMRITTDKTEVICSGNHRFLASNSRHWIHAENLTLRSQIRSIGCRPGSTDGWSYAAGYLMGMTDGDGTWRFVPGQQSDKKGFPQCYWRVALTDEEALLATQSYLQRFGLKAEIKPFRVNNGRGHMKTMQRLELRAIPHLTILDEILNYQQDDDFGRGYLAGIFDAEGSFTGANLRISNTNRDYLERVIEYAGALALDFRIENNIRDVAFSARLYGPRRDRVAFFTLTRPAIQRKAKALLSSSIETDSAIVTKLESLGVRDLIDIETSTHTFYANGLATHNCYAETFAERFRGVQGHPYEQGFDLKLWPNRLELPLRWKKPKMIFVNSMSDLFHSQVPEAYIRQVFEIMCQAHWHTFQVLTKRAGRLRRLGPTLDWPSNVWMGVSIELDPLTARADALRVGARNAAVRFLSCEPLLGPLPSLQLDTIQWVITGGESGLHARPCNPEWVRDIRDRCLEAGVAFFHKQWGGRTPKAGGRLLDGQTWDEYPKVPVLMQ